MTVTPSSSGSLRPVPIALAIGAVALFVLAGVSAKPSVILSWRAAGALLLLLAGATELRLRAGYALATAVDGAALLAAIGIGGLALLSFPAQDSFSAGLVVALAAIAIPLVAVFGWVLRTTVDEWRVVRPWNLGDAVVAVIAGLLGIGIAAQLAVP